MLKFKEVHGTRLVHHADLRGVDHGAQAVSDEHHGGMQLRDQLL